jgi:hypothetical protein
MQASILNIDEDILICVLSKWSEIVDVVKLDSAVGVRRDLFLNLIKDDRMYSLEFQNLRSDLILPTYTWCILREIKFRNILICGEDSLRIIEIIPHLMNYNCTHLTLLYLRSDCYTNRLALFVNSCSHLTNMIIKQSDFDIFELSSLTVHVRSDVWKALIKLSFSGMAKELDTNIFLGVLCENCRLLTSLELITYSLNETSLEALIKSNPSLTEISLSGYGVNQSFVDFLILNCTNITKLSLHAPSLLSVESLFKLLENVVSVAANCVKLTFVDLLSRDHRFSYYSSDKNEVCGRLFCNDNWWLFRNDNEHDLESYYKTFVNLDKPYLDCTGNFKLLLDHHFLSPLALLTDLTHVSVESKYMNDESLLSMLRTHKKLVTISVDIGDSQEYPNLLSAPFVDHHSLKMIKIIRKGRSNVWITMNLDR